MATKKSTLHIDGENRGAINAIKGTTDRLGKAVGDVQRAGTGLSGALSGFGSVLTNIPFLAAAAAGGVVFGFSQMIKKSIDFSEKLEKLSQKTGFTAEELSTLKYSADIGSVAFDVMSKGLEKFSKNLGDVAVGVGQTAKYGFDALGIQVTDSSGKIKSASELLPVVADKFSKMEDGTRKTWVAMTLFGRAGAELIPVLNKGKKGLDEEADAARKLGLEISTNTAKQAAHFKDNMTILESSLTGMANQIASLLLPTLILITDQFSESAKSGGLLNATMMIASGTIKFLTGQYFLYSGILKSVMNLQAAFVASVIAIAHGDLAMVPELLKKGFENSKDAIKNSIEQFKKLSNGGETYDNILKRIKDSQDAATSAANLKKLKIEWDSLSRKLQNDIAKNSLPAIAFQIHNIDKRFTEYAAKFPEHIELIKDWKDSMIAAAVDIDKTLQSIKPSIDKAMIPDVQPSELISPDFMEQLKKQHDEQIAEASRLTTAELTNIAIRQQATSDMFDNMAGAAQNFYQASGNQSKAFFAVYKAFAIAKAGIDTYNAAIAAYEAMVGIPIVGPGLAVAAAAAATAFGLSNIARIAAMQPGSSAAGGVAGSATAAAPSPGTINNNSNSDNRRVQYTINFYGDSSNVTDKDKLARDLIDSINKATEDGLILKTS